ncbi:MAG: hypothetical protein ACREUC_15625, partial [Steroidobacteraceae bacterium]
MAWSDLLVYLVSATLIAFAGVALVRIGWRVRSRLKIRRAEPRRLLATRHRIWRDPGVVTRADLRFGPG